MSDAPREVRGVMATDNQELKKKSDELYERYGKPLEQEHWGKYIAIFPDGRTIIGDTPHEVLDKAVTTFGRGSFVYKIGPRAVWTFR